MNPERMAEALGGQAYPDGAKWRCPHCAFACDDDGPDNCPVDGAPLSRTLLIFPTPTAEPEEGEQ